jgi:tetratricopeptide (TPR) repeat protein
VTSAIRPPVLLLLPLFAVLYGASVGLTMVRDVVAPGNAVERSVLYVPSPKVLDRMVLSYDALAADVYWMRALQIFGSTRLAKAGDYHLLYPLLNIATSLDPMFNIAYRFGAIFLSEPPPGGPGRPDQAIALLQRGLEARPDNWRYMQDIGFVHYTARRDYAAAAEWFEKAAAVPGAPWWLKSLAATTRATGGDRAGARALWRSLHESAADNEWLRNEANRRLLQLDALDAADQLQRLVHQWISESSARPPYSWEGFGRAGRIRRVPLDPSGTPFAIDPRTGNVSIDEQSPLRLAPHEQPSEPVS